MKLTGIKWKLASLFLILSLPAAASEAPYKEYKKPIFFANLFSLRLKEVLPADAAEYIELFRNCQHWHGEPAYNLERGEQIKQEVEKNCTDLNNRKTLLDKKYKKESKETENINAIIKEIEAGKNLPSFIFNDQQKKSSALNIYYEAQAQSILRLTPQLIEKYNSAIKEHKKTINRATVSSKNKIKMARYMLEVQQRYLLDVISNIDRLQPTTLKQIKSIKPELSKTLATQD